MDIKPVVLDVSASFQPYAREALLKYAESQLTFIESVLYILYGLFGITGSEYEFDKNFYVVLCDDGVRGFTYINLLSLKNNNHIDFECGGGGSNLQAGVDFCWTYGYTDVSVITDGYIQPLDHVEMVVYSPENK
jgi:hypothetical protein